MKILLTTHQFLPFFSAGTEILTHSVALELIGQGHTVHVLTGYPTEANLNDTERFDEYDIDGIHVYRFYHSYTPMGGQSSLLEIDYNNNLAAFYFEKILALFGPDLVHFFHLNRLGTGLIECAIRAKVCCFFTPTDFWSICPLGQLLLENGELCNGPSENSGNCLKHFIHATQRGGVVKLATLLPTKLAGQLVRLTQQKVLPVYPRRQEVLALGNRLHTNVLRLNKLNGIVAPNKFMQDFLVRHGVNEELIKVSSFGIRDAVATKILKESQHNSRLSIGFIGTLAPHKGCHILIDAFNRLPRESAILKIYGKLDDFPEYTKKLVNLIGSQDSVSFCGAFPNSEIGKVLSGIDILVIPSTWYENTPLVLFSAQAAHRPVIVSDLPGLTDVVQHEKNGLVFKHGSSSDLADQLLRLINDINLYSRLARQAVVPKTIKSYTDELLGVWNSCIAEKDGGG